MRRKELIEKRTGLKLKETEKYEKGKTYYCSYWNSTFEVLDIIPNEIWKEEYKCLWSNGRITTHTTKLDPEKDYEVIAN